MQIIYYEFLILTELDNITDVVYYTIIIIYVLLRI